MRVYDSIVSDDLIQHFPHWKGTDFTLSEYARNTSTIQEAIALVSWYWPTIIEDEGCVFLAAHYSPEQVAYVKQHFNNDKRRMERWVNGQALVEFFGFGLQHGDDDSILEDRDVLLAFGRALQTFWLLRLKSLFPERTFIVELSDQIEGESGLAITMYEK